jgi:hypothetical protein
MNPDGEVTTATRSPTGRRTRRSKSSSKGMDGESERSESMGGASGDALSHSPHDRRQFRGTNSGESTGSVPRTQSKEDHLVGRRRVKQTNSHGRSTKDSNEDVQQVPMDKSPTKHIHVDARSKSPSKRRHHQAEDPTLRTPNNASIRSPDVRSRRRPHRSGSPSHSRKRSPTTETKSDRHHRGRLLSPRTKSSKDERKESSRRSPQSLSPPMTALEKLYSPHDQGRMQGHGLSKVAQAEVRAPRTPTHGRSNP